MYVDPIPRPAYSACERIDMASGLVQTVANAPTKAEAGTPVALFFTPAGSEYAASPDGQRFLVDTITEDASPITVLLNWKPGVK